MDAESIPGMFSCNVLKVVRVISWLDSIFIIRLRLSTNIFA